MSLIPSIDNDRKGHGEKPEDTLNKLAKDNGAKATDEKFSQWLDKNDKLSHFRKDFIIPQTSSFSKKRVSKREDDNCVYLAGNGLGLQPKMTSSIVTETLEHWRNYGLLCHFKGPVPAAQCDASVIKSISNIVGAFEDEIAIMNGLSVNLHLMLVSFYQPTKARHKILYEPNAFSSDYVVIKSHIEQRGYNSNDSMLTAKLPKEALWKTDDILTLIETEGDSIALVLMSGVHYFTGQLFDMEAITKAAHKKGCMVGFDLAHAAGNVELYLHDWGVDFACLCTYKYLNSGPGCLAGCFMHQKHKNNNFPKFLGWWGHKEETRFEMKNKLDLTSGIIGYRISNPSPTLAACIRASLDIFDQTNMRELRKKSILLTGYLELLLKHYFAKGKSDPCIDIITPSDFKHRGSQLSLKLSRSISGIDKQLEEHGVICTVRDTAIRVAPVPLYNSFHDVFRFVEILKEILPTSQ